jgi:hypothetical protein
MWGRGRLSGADGGTANGGRGTRAPPHAAPGLYAEAGWQGRSPADCPGVWGNAYRPRALESAIVSRSHGGVGLCGERIVSERAPGAEKNERTPWLIQQWRIPPKQSSEFVYRREDVLAVYTRPYDPKYPQGCMDEKSLQLLAAPRASLSPKPKQVAKQDYQDQRQGTANVLMCFESLAGRRPVKVTTQRTQRDWAECSRDRAETQYPKAEKILS